MRIVERQPAAPVGGFGDDTPPLIQRLYLNRGLTGTAQLGRKLGELPPPDTFKGLEAAIDLLVGALEQDWRILIVGDFDADGATSTALMVLALAAMGARNVDFLVPNRFEFGYGLTPEIVALAEERSPDLIVTVDNGISSIDGVAAAKLAGIRVLITDHHLPGAQTPDADAIVNPNQRDCPFPGKHLAGVGVAFYLLSALRSALRQRGYFDRAGLREPNMAEWLDLVALGTVADVVPLDHANRVLVHQGIQRVRAGVCRPGIRALLEAAGRDHRRLVAADFGFAVGPRLNAAGRLDDMSLGIHCLLTADPEEAKQLATELDDLNRDRRQIEAGMQQEALASLAKLHLDADTLPWGVCIFDPGWHQGVVGLLASRVKDRYHRPVIAFARTDSGELKGSARSIPGLHMRDALETVATAHPGLLSKFGGHAMAAGLSLDADRFEDFCRAFDGAARKLLAPADLEEEILFDGELEPRDINEDNARLIRDAGPWGQHFPEPLFRGDFRVVQRRVLGGKHLKLVLSPPDDLSRLIDGIAFNVPAEHLGAQAPHVEILYRLDLNLWRGRESAQLLIERILSFTNAI